MGYLVDVVSCSRGVRVLPFYDDSFFGFCVACARDVGC